MIRQHQMRQRTDPALCHRTRPLCQLVNPSSLRTDPARCHRTRTLCQLVNPSLKVVLRWGRQVNRRRTDQKFRHRLRTLSQL